MQIYVITGVWRQIFKVVAVNRSTIKVPLGRCSISGVWGYRSGAVLPPTTVILSITKSTRTHISITNVPCETRPLRSPDPQVDLDYWSKSRALQTGDRPLTLYKPADLCR
ncbi:hypothetical protein Zmor_010839 [Zophobas morio]|uniref:Uncharacterized protein n=1 Tax=Zophobas morio TaxID=2755281 RepID=A0AA38IPD1_9CUCU|nr:hypothetical protein Zmor_010839 [Zophobas morio]